MTHDEMEAAIVRINQRLEAAERELREMRGTPPPAPPSRGWSKAMGT